MTFHKYGRHFNSEMEKVPKPTPTPANTMVSQPPENDDINEYSPLYEGGKGFKTEGYARNISLHAEVTKKRKCDRCCKEARYHP